MADIVILGAGLTGISTAYHLEQRGFSDYLMFEKEETIGGLCRTIKQDGFTFDYTGHLLHTSDAYFRTLIESVVGLENLNAVNRKSFIYSHDTYTRYPFQMNLYGLPEEVIVECIEGYVTRPSSDEPPTSFHDWVMHTFGAGFGKHFFFPYQAKIFSCDINELSASWTSRFVPSTSLTQIIRGAIKDTYDPTIGYNANFLYPKTGGIFFWVNKLAQQIKKKIHTSYCVTEIDLKEKVVTFSNGHTQRYHQLINTLPLDTFLSLIKESPTSFLKQAKNNLKCNSVINFNIGVNHEHLSDKHWIYFPEEQYPFYRIGFPHNFSAQATPPGCSSLYGEFSYINQSTEWINDRLATALSAAKKVLDISPKNIATELIIPISHAYVIYDFWREKHLPSLLKTLEENKVYCVGRYAEWKYASMQDAVLDGKKIAERLTIMPALHEKELPAPLTHPSSKQKQL